MRLLAICMGLLFSGIVYAQDVTPQTACPSPVGGWPMRPSFICVDLTPEIITSLEGVTRAQVRQILGAPGKCSEGEGMCYYDDWNTKEGSHFGSVAVYYDSVGDTRHIHAHSEQAFHSPFTAGYYSSDHPNPSFEVEWDNLFDDLNCSDFSGKPKRCNP
ncbi:hypothetical protein [Acetobacter pasteurianus]|uniref:hypothetical protein n=1 Tax=Acetobacter pasteurianus TaxID=438 RepID=UPI003D0A460E